MFVRMLDVHGVVMSMIMRRRLDQNDPCCDGQTEKKRG